MEIVFTGYFFIIIFVFVVVILLSFLYYLDNDLGATNMKDNKRIDLQIEAESISTDSKPTNGKTRKRRLYEASGLNIEPYHKKPRNGKINSTSIKSLIPEEGTAT